VKHLKQRLVEQDRQLNGMRGELNKAIVSLAEANARNDIIKEFKYSCTRIYQQNLAKLDKTTTKFAHYCNQVGVLPVIPARAQSTSSAATAQSTTSSATAPRSTSSAAPQGPQRPLQPTVDPNNR
jgi:hypothetical protein